VTSPIYNLQPPTSNQISPPPPAGFPATTPSSLLPSPSLTAPATTAAIETRSNADSPIKFDVPSIVQGLTAGTLAPERAIQASENKIREASAELERAKEIAALLRGPNSLSSTERLQARNYVAEVGTNAQREVEQATSIQKTALGLLGNTPTGTTSDSTITTTPASGVVTPEQKQQAEDTLEAAKELGEPDSKTLREVFEAKKVLLAYGRQVDTTKEKEQAKAQAQADTQSKTGSVAPLEGVTPTAPAKTPKEKKFDDEKVNTLTTLKRLAEKANVNVGALVSSLLVADDVVESTGPQEFGSFNRQEFGGRGGAVPASVAKFDNLAKALKIIKPKDLVETLNKVDPNTKRTLLDSLKDTLTGGGNAAFFERAGLDPGLFTLLRQEPNVRRVLGLTAEEVASKEDLFFESVENKNNGN
jgi:hypothetical protein